MEKEHSDIKQMHEAEGRQKINRLEEKLSATKNNIEISQELIAGTPSDAHREKLIEKNAQRRHAAGSLRKEIRELEQTLKKRDSEVST